MTAAESTSLTTGTPAGQMSLPGTSSVTVKPIGISNSGASFTARIVTGTLTVLDSPCVTGPSAIVTTSVRAPEALAAGV